MTCHDNIRVHYPLNMMSMDVMQLDGNVYSYSIYLRDKSKTSEQHKA